MLADCSVQLNLPFLKAPLARLQAQLVQSFDGIRGTGDDIDCLVYNTIGADSENASELDSVEKNLAKALLRSEDSAWFW